MVDVVAKDSLAGTEYGELGRTGLATFAARPDVDTSFESGEGRFGQFVQPAPEQTVLLRAEQKACPALLRSADSSIFHITILTGHEVHSL